MYVTEIVGQTGEHDHRQSRISHIYFLLSGNANLVIEDEEFPLKMYEASRRITPDKKHYIKNVGEAEAVVLNISDGELDLDDLEERLQKASSKLW